MRVKDKNGVGVPFMKTNRELDTASREVPQDLKTPTNCEEVDVDFGSMTSMAFEETEDYLAGQKTSQVLPAGTIEVEDDFDFGDVASADELYRYKENEKAVDGRVLNAVNENMKQINSSMNDVVLKQAEVLSKNADQMQSMQGNLTMIVTSQAKLVDSMSNAIDQKFAQNNVNMREIITDATYTAVDETVGKPLEKRNKKQKKKDRKEKFWGIIKFLVVAVILFFLYLNDTTRTRIGIVAADVMELVIGIANGEEVSTNKLVRDIGIKLHKANTTYYDEEGEEISEEEYYQKLYSTEKDADNIINYIEENEEGR